jgi:two-component system, sensor histidine kinase YesM
MYTYGICKGEAQMKNKNLSARFIGKFSSIQSVIFATVAVLVLSAVVIVTGVSMKFTNTSIFENSSEYTHTIIQQMNQNIDSYIDYMENIAYLISSNEDVQDYLFDEKIDNEGRYRILNQLQTILDSRSDIRNVGIISKNGRMLINDGSKSVNQDLDLNTQEWYATALEKPNGPILTSSHVQHIISGERPWVITLSRGIRDRSGSGEKEGVFFIDLNYSAISELCDQSTVGTKGYAFILDAKGNIVYHPQQQQLYNELQTENISLIMDTDEDTVLTGTGNDGKLYSISRSEKTGWTVVDCTNVKELLSKSRQAQSVYVLTAIILVIVALLFSRFMARSITLPIQKLRDSMKKVQEGDFSVSDVVVDSKNEIGSLTKSFDVMTHRIHELMEQNVHEQEEKRKSELKALQSQINPHFLYNTLDSIIWMAEGKKNEEVVLMTASLARLLRQSISNEDEVVPIANEVEYARGYLTIQKMRYKDKLEFQIEVDSSILYIPLIKLVLQPIIENAIYHGLKYKESKGLLIVKGFMKDGNAVLQVIDDGVGMDEETLAHIYDKHKVNYHSNGVGVYNVQKRLKLYYGEDYGITYTSELGKGTTATITIPGRQEGQI